MARPYFRDWNNLRFHEGKTFVSPPRAFRRDVSLYFPNLRGRTLERGISAAEATRDTTPTLRGKVSVVSVFSGLWGEGQAESLTCVVPSPFGKIGGLNCWEHLQPLLRYYEYSQGVQIHVAYIYPPPVIQ